MKPHHEHFPNLQQFLSCYFHEDWMHDSSNMDAVIARFASEVPDNDLSNTVAELHRLLLLDIEEQELDGLLMKMGSRYYYQADGMTSRQWVSALRERLAMLRSHQ